MHRRHRRLRSNREMRQSDGWIQLHSAMTRVTTSRSHGRTRLFDDQQGNTLIAPIVVIAVLSSFALTTERPIGATTRRILLGARNPVPERDIEALGLGHRRDIGSRYTDESSSEPASQQAQKISATPDRNKFSHRPVKAFRSSFRMNPFNWLQIRGADFSRGVALGLTSHVNSFLTNPSAVISSYAAQSVQLVTSAPMGVLEAAWRSSVDGARLCVHQDALLTRCAGFVLGNTAIVSAIGVASAFRSGAATKATSMDELASSSREATSIVERADGKATLGEFAPPDSPPLTTMTVGIGRFGDGDGVGGSLPPHFGPLVVGDLRNEELLSAVDSVRRSERLTDQQVGDVLWELLLKQPRLVVGDDENQLTMLQERLGELGVETETIGNASHLLSRLYPTDSLRLEGELASAHGRLGPGGRLALLESDARELVEAGHLTPSSDPARWTSKSR